MKTISLFTSALLGLLTAAHSASVVVNWSTNRQLNHRHESGDLSAGTPMDGDGALLQLGYFTLGTLADPFAGNWTVLAIGSIGDQGGLADGYFSIATTLETGAFDEPAVGTPLGVRYFDGTSIAGSSYFNTAANVDGTGLWQAPADPAPVINLEISKTASRFEDNPGAFQTSIPVPESSVVFLACVALACGEGWRKRA